MTTPQPVPLQVRLEAITRANRDVISAAKTLNIGEVRYMVDSYYQLQDYRKAANSQARSIDQDADTGPTGHQTLDWLGDQMSAMEDQIKRALDAFSAAHMTAPWLRNVYGVGPVIAAGLIAHIDIEVCPTVGHIWRFAGLDPTRQWGKGEKRPWNAELKTLCWKIGQSFMKFSGRPECYYGGVYRTRKECEQARNEAGGNTAAAAAVLERKPTHAQRAIYAEGKLPPAQIDARARRYAVKLFLSHLHEVWYTAHFGKAPPLPYPVAILGHAHITPPPQ